MGTCLRLAALLSLGLTLLLASTASAAPRPADTVFLNGYVHTVDKRMPLAHAVAVRGGKIACVGSNGAARAFIGEKTKVVDLNGRMMLPGFTDAHAHANETIQRLLEVQLYGAKSVDECLAFVDSFVQDHPDMAGYRGVGWDNTIAPGIGPLARDLDAVVADKPVVLMSADHHSVWVNIAALRAAGITKDTPDPPNGKIERFDDGAPSGTLREDAMDLVSDVIPPYARAQYEEALLAYQRDVANPFGITQVLDPYLVLGSPIIDAYERLARTGKLTVRFRGAIHLSPDKPVAAQIKAAAAERAKHRGPLFRMPLVKMLEDGVVEGHTAYLLKPYADAAEYSGDPHYRGTPIWPRKKLRAASIAATRAGFQLHYHAIGDAAVHECLDAIEAAEKASGKRSIRPAITHLQLVDRRDVERFRPLGVIAVPQPFWAVSDDYYWNLQLPYLGKYRADREYPIRSFVDRGVTVASASDFPVTVPPDPLVGIETGVLRWYQGLSHGSEVLWPRERCTVQQMIKSYTLGGAKSLRLGRVSGSITAGKSADLVVLSRNILELPPQFIGHPAVSHVDITYFRGQKVYDRSSGAQP